MFRQERFVVAGVLALISTGCAQAPDLVESNRQAINPTQDQNQLAAKSFDASKDLPKESHPHVTIHNSTAQLWTGFTFYYYFTVDTGKTPQIDSIDDNGTDVGLEHVMGNQWRVRFACRGCSIDSGEDFPNPDGVDLRLRYTDGSAWNKSDDPSYAPYPYSDESQWRLLPYNTKIPIFDNNYHLVGGTEVIKNWPSDTPTTPTSVDLFEPLPSSFAFTVPAPAGSWTPTESVPDTLDLADIARQTINNLTQSVDYESTDPAYHFKLFFTTDFRHNPPVQYFDPTSVTDLGKSMDPILLSRLSSGSSDDADIERRLLKGYLYNYDNVTQEGGAAARSYEAFAHHYFRSNNTNPVWKTLALQGAQNMVERLIVPEGADYGYFPSDHAPNSWWSLDPWADEILLMAYKQFGYAPALDAVGKHIRWARYESGSFSDDGAIQNVHESGTSHFHVGALSYLPFLDYGLLVKDQELIDWVRKSFDWARSGASGALQTIGFFPEFTQQSRGETCGTTDMIITGMRLSQAGIHDYWDNVDTWVRNHFAESHLGAAKAECIENWSRANYPEISYSFQWDNDTNPHFSWKGTTRRVQGGFAGEPAYNAWKANGIPGMQQCCNANGSRAAYFIWDNIANLTGSAGNYVVKVNLMLNRIAPVYEVQSYLPYEGKVTLKARQAISQAWVRIPSGYTTGISARIVGGSSRAVPQPVGRYYNFGALSVNQVLEVTFPNLTTTESLQFNGDNVNITKRGNTVVSLTPGGDVCAMYADRKAMIDTIIAPPHQKARWISTEPNLFAKKDTTWKLPAKFVDSPGVNGSYTGAKAIDGSQDDDSRWSATGDGKYVTFDLGRSYDIKYFNVASIEVDDEWPARNLELKVSSNGTTWTSVCKKTTSGHTRALEAVACSGSGRYVRVVGHGSNQGMDNDLTEIEFWGSTTAAIAELTYPNPTASTNQSNTSKVKDGSTSTYWTGGGTGAWILMDLGALKSLDTVELAIRNGTSRVQYFDIETSVDGQRWTLVLRGQNDKTTNALQSYDVPNIAARYVRIVGRGASTDDDLSLSEIKVKGY